MGLSSYTTATDQEVMRLIGERLAALRESQGLPVMEAAERAGISRRTLYRAERGQNPTLETVVRLLRAYGRVAALDGFIPEAEVSPMAVLREHRRGAGG